jgi:hypothetical protein
LKIGGTVILCFVFDDTGANLFDRGVKEEVYMHARPQLNRCSLTARELGKTNSVPLSHTG